METQRGVSAIIYDKRGDKHYFLLLHRVSNWQGWEFPKGKLEEGETVLQAATREIKEETGLKKFNIKGSLVNKREFTHNDRLYSFETFLVEANMNVVVDISGSEEHDNYIWTDKEGVLAKLYWHEEKSQFKEAIAVLESSNI
ncbi:NUDIX domain-containing protein [Candidatus Woesearchaeota archaeon]|nr:NUDIX domain-containing protein [Candidatus Woesearchaeota archaeon]